MGRQQHHRALGLLTFSCIGGAWSRWRRLWTALGQNPQAFVRKRKMKRTFTTLHNNNNQKHTFKQPKHGFIRGILKFWNGPESNWSGGWSEEGGAQEMSRCAVLIDPYNAGMKSVMKCAYLCNHVIVRFKFFIPPPPLSISFCFYIYRSHWRFRA